MNFVFKCKGKDLVETLNITALTDGFMRVFNQVKDIKRTSRPSKSN